ncbi:MAG: prepilin-type N-terminal cleavage/methylation domain-containing protein [Planctomycetota bacterium]
MRCRAGFTIVELVVVVVIIGVITAVAIPRFSRANQNALTNAAARDFRQIETALRLYYADHRAWPPNQLSGVYPPELAGYYDQPQWESGPTFGDRWDWNPNLGPLRPHVSMYGEDFGAQPLVEFDARFDDGDVNTGNVQRWGAFGQLAWKITP